MTGKYRALLVSENEELAAQARSCLSSLQPAVVIQRLPDPAIASARLGGGDIDMLLVDPAALGDRLREWIKGLPPIATIVTTGSWTAELSRVAGAYRTKTGARQSGDAGHWSPDAPQWIGFLGAKGGVGTSTVSLNVACALAERDKVLLAELSSGVDTLALHVASSGGAPSGAGSSSGLFQRLRGTIEKPTVRLGLREDIVGGQSPENFCQRLDASVHQAAVDFVVLDLGAILTGPVCSVLPRLDSLIILLDWEALSVECGRRTLNAIAEPGGTPVERIQTLIVNRSAIGSPLGLEEIEKAMGMPAVAAIPPAADLCCAAAKARRPIVRLDPQSLVADSLIRAARSIAEAMDEVRGTVRGFSKVRA